MNNEIKIVSVRKIYELLDAIRLKHKYWLTSKSIIALQNFLSGYMQLGFADDIYHEGEPNIENFKLWILLKRDKNLGVFHSYSNVLLPECDGDEEKAFDNFFEYLDEFKREQKN